MRRRLIKVLAVIVFLGMVLTAIATREALALRHDLRQTQADFDAALSTTEPLLGDVSSFRDSDAALQAAATHLRAAQRSLDAAQQHAHRLRPLLALGARLPGWPSGLGAVDPLIAMAQQLAGTGLTLSDAFHHLTTQLDQPAADNPSTGARLTSALADSEPAFRSALTSLDHAAALRQGVPADQLSGPLRSGRAALATFDRHRAALHDDLTLLVQLPGAARSVLGMNGPRTYAILGQNSAELRPTGGFIGSLGVVTVDHGTIVAQDYRSSYSFDNPDRGFDLLPEPM